MSEWPVKSVGDLATFHRGITWASSQETDKPEPGCVPVLRIPNVQERLNTTSILFLRGISEEKRRRFAATRNWLLMVGSNGNPNRVGDCVLMTHDPHYLFASFLVGVEPNLSEGVDPCFLHYLLRSESVRKAVSDSIKGTTGLRNISLSHLAAHRLRCPPPTEQRKIARILTSLDNLIEKTEALIAKYQAIKQGMMHDLFTRGVDEHGHLRPSYAQDPDLYHETPLGWIPNEWEANRVGDHLDCIEQGWSPDCDSEPASADEWGVLKTTAVVWDGFDWRENKRLPRHLLPITQYEIHVEDVLMTRGGPNSRVGVVAIVRETRNRLMLSDKTYRLVPKKSIVPGYLALALASEHTQTHLSTLKTGLAESQTNISQEIVRRLWIGFPRPDEQQRTCERIQAIEKRLQAEFKSLGKLRLLKTGLMQDLLTGKVRVKGEESKEVAAHA